MFGKPVCTILLVFILAGFVPAAENDTLYIRCGHVYRGAGQWSNPGDMWAVTSGKTFPMPSYEKKSGYLDMNHFWMIPALNNFWVPRTLDSSYSRYPYVQTGLPGRIIRKIYQDMLKEGIISFVLYPDGAGIRSGDVLELVFPGTFSLKGLMIFQENITDSLHKTGVESMEYSCSAREKERLYQWKNHEFPLFSMKKDSTGQQYLVAMYFHEYDTDTVCIPMIRALQEVELLDPNDSLLMTYKDTDHLFMSLHQLKPSAGIRLLDHVSGCKPGEPYPPHILFLSENPLKKPAHIKFMMINGKFSANK